MISTDDIKKHLRVSSSAFDAEIELCVNSACEDMLRVGVPESFVYGGSSLVDMAIVYYCKANFGFDNDEAPRFEKLYRKAVIDMSHSYSLTGGEW